MIHYLKMLALRFLMDFHEGLRAFGEYVDKRYLGKP